MQISASLKIDGIHFDVPDDPALISALLQRIGVATCKEQSRVCQDASSEDHLALISVVPLSLQQEPRQLEDWKRPSVDWSTWEKFLYALDDLRRKGCMKSSRKAIMDHFRDHYPTAGILNANNIEAFLLNARKRRALMSEETVEGAVYWLTDIGIAEALALRESGSSMRRRKPVSNGSRRKVMQQKRRAEYLAQRQQSSDSVLEAKPQTDDDEE